MAKKLALGKGIASLLHDATPNTVVNQTYNSHYGNPQEHTPAAPVEKEIEIRYENTPLLVNVGSIKTNPNQPRKIFKEKDLDELAESIRENGIIQPLIVAELENGEYELVAGERRLRASKKI
jgi:ParB family chromosome partitioning protein